MIKKILILFILILLFIPDKITIADGLESKNNFDLSPYTGYTRQHWLEITEKIITGVMPYFNDVSGQLELPYENGEWAYKNFREKRAEPTLSRALERSLMAVVYYTKATGKDKIPGYSGSVSAPFIRAIITGTDPEHPSFWGDPAPNEQVASSFAMAVYINPELFWEPLTAKQKRNLLSYLEKQAYVSSHDNNHYYFHTVACALLEQNGFKSNREHLMNMSERLMGWYRGDGWFLDGSNQGFDYYNFWGFHLFNQVLFRFDPVWREKFGEKTKRTANLFNENNLYLYGANGAPVQWGRSMSYRFAANASLCWSLLNGYSTMPPGQARRILSGTLKYFWEQDCLGENGLLNLGYHGANTAVAEAYLSPGDPYWATHGLACLLIPENDRFWTEPEQPIPADDTGGRKVLSGPEMLFRVNGGNGEARMYPVGQPFFHNRGMWQSGVKYDQHAYSSHLGFCVTGERTGEIGAGRTGYSYNGEKWHFRERAQAIQIKKDHLISIYKMKPAPGDERVYSSFTANEITTHTLVGNNGEIHVFWHNYPEQVYLHLGGYGISVPHGTDEKVDVHDDFIKITGGEYQTAMQVISAVKGISTAEVLTPSEGWKHTHLYGGKGVFPVWRSSAPVPPGQPQVFYVNGAHSRKIEMPELKMEASPDKLKIQFEGNWHVISLPY